MQNKNSKTFVSCVRHEVRALDQEESESSCIKNLNSQLEIMFIDQMKYRRDSISNFYSKI